MSGQKLYLSELEIKLLYGIMSSVDCEGLNEKESESLSQLAVKIWKLKNKIEEE